MQTTTLRLAVLALACATSGAFAAGKTLSVKEHVDLPVPPAKAWETIHNFDGWQTWHPVVASTAITQGKGNEPGTVRVLTTKDGAKLTEELVTFKEKPMSYSYKINESPLPVTDYLSTLKVSKSATGSTVTWSSKFKAKDGTSDADAKKVVSGIYTAGLDNLKATLK